ncbi:ABC transporter ATP-binding protein [Clostridiaceae bacterium HSG29]|nr:ABC transporter ATP-binding protein [Clostridiaceae bacterium HSG29]
MIKCESVSKSYGDVNAVNNVSFEIGKGAFLGLLGPNGAGKTTLMRTMIGLLDPSEGSIFFNNIKMNKDNLEIKEKIGVVTQHINLDKELTINENMIFAAKLYKISKDKINIEIKKVLKLLGLYELKDRKTKKLSGGMKRKLMIAKAIIHNPDFIFLDEPTVGIDVNTRKEIWQFLRHENKKGKTIVLTTHYIEEAEQLCDLVMLMSDGKIFKEDTSKNLINEIGDFKVEYSDTEVFLYQSLEEAKNATKNSDKIFSISRTSLEDVFFYYTNKKVN